MSSNLSDFYKGKDILVTGGCGSIGSEIVKQLLDYDVKRIRVFDHNESGQFHLQERLQNDKLRTLIGNIRDKERLKWAMKDVDIVFHAAALKHVPICEYNPFEAVATNVYGTQNVIDVAREEGVEKVMLISTDKAVNPINTMGATKLLCEKLILNAPIGDIKTAFSCVRFGNVLNSDGSVIPIFKEQIKNGGPVTITSADMVRFFMSMQEAINLVLKATEKMMGREIFILKMQALRVIDLAEVMIEELAPKHGYQPEKIKIKVIGVRPGEKLRESLLTEEEALYAEDSDGMLVLRPGVITPHYVIKSSVTRPVDSKKYDGKEVDLLSKDEIRKIISSVL
ncbi:MAG: polysaccharide biosynthesis protein [Candidatus Aenigmarchaeota archaeon]|nr:polysaccharide biosynthesis protein [Candidatus Aenigmarchaeota archaeon]